MWEEKQVRRTLQNLGKEKDVNNITVTSVKSKWNFEKDKDKIGFLSKDWRDLIRSHLQVIYTNIFIILWIAPVHHSFAVKSW